MKATRAQLHELWNAGNQAAGSRIVKSVCPAPTFSKLWAALRPWPLNEATLSALEVALMEVAYDPAVYGLVPEVVDRIAGALASLWETPVAEVRAELRRFAEGEYLRRMGEVA